MEEKSGKNFRDGEIGDWLGICGTKGLLIRAKDPCGILIWREGAMGYSELLRKYGDNSNCAKGMIARIH